MRPSFFHHLHPPTIPTQQARWRHTLAAGGTAIFLLLVVGITGILEMLYYTPDPQSAAQSVQIITYHVPFGWLIRNLHYWSAQWLVIISALHLLRVVFTAAYAAPRRFNYLLGMGLFALLILLDFTGYILRGDSGVCASLLVFSNTLKSTPIIGHDLYLAALGAQQPCFDALPRIYTWHIFGLTLAALLLVAWHSFRVRRDGGIAAPETINPTEETRIPRAELIKREIFAMLIVAGGLLLCSVFFPAPIAAATKHTAQPITIPWFMLWIQNMLAWGNPFLFGVLIPLALFLLVSFIPYLFRSPAARDHGVWFAQSNRLAQFCAMLLVLLILILSFSQP